MLRYLHCYHPATWEAQVRAGLVNEAGGIRFVQSITVDEDLKFNRLARVGGDLWNLVRELRCPFYIDRLQGGDYIETYDYDMSLVDAYRGLLGENFWGFQMHEWMSNYRSDLGKLQKGKCPAWTEEAITETIFREFPFPHLFLEAMTAAEMANHCKPETADVFFHNVEWLFADRQKYTRGDLLPCDSGYLAPGIELKYGVKRLMPEIGAQTSDTRIQLSYARGMTKAYGKPFGAYLEPWGGDPFSAPCYQRDGENEWCIRGEDFPFATCGENGGSSRSMQRRMQLYAYMAGASFLSEEWGMCNTFYDWHDFELTPYGEVKKEFIRFTEKYPDVGELLTPVAVVLPSGLPVLNDVRNTDDGMWCGFAVDGGKKTALATLRGGLRKLFMESTRMLGSETVSLLNGTVPDALDIVNADCLDAERYERIVDLSGENLAAKLGEKVISAEKVLPALEDLLPAVFEGGAQKLITRAGDGTHYLMLLNNSGVVRSVAGGEYTLPEADTNVTVRVKGERSLSMLEGNSAIHKLENGAYAVDIPAGGWFFGKF